jgi:hypothetical protein
VFFLGFIIEVIVKLAMCFRLGSSKVGLSPIHLNVCY